MTRAAAPRPGRPGALASTGRPGLSITGSEVLLNEPRAEVDIQLDERAVADAAEAVDLARLDHEDVAGAGLELLSFDVVQPASLLNELHLVVRMAVRPRAAAGEPVEEEDGNADVAVVGADEVVRAADERQVGLLDSIHARSIPEWAEVWLVPPGDVSASALAICFEQACKGVSVHVDQVSLLAGKLVEHHLVHPQQSPVFATLEVRRSDEPLAQQGQCRSERGALDQVGLREHRR